MGGAHTGFGVIPSSRIGMVEAAEAKIEREATPLSVRHGRMGRGWGWVP
jgi:hypothetical protein